MIRLLYCFAFAVLEIGAAQAAIDLDSEAEPSSAVWMEWEAGLGPALKECRVNERGSLRCEADEEIQDAECYGREASRERRLKVNVIGSAFACEVLAKTADLSRLWRIVVVGKSGGVTRWSAEGRTAEQTRNAYLYEMKAGRTVRRSIRRIEVGVGGGAAAVPGSFFPFTDVFAHALLTERIVAGLNYDRSFGAAAAVGFGGEVRANLGYLFWKGERDSSVGLFLGYQRRVRGAAPFETPRLGFMADTQVYSWLGCGGEVSSGWPSFLEPRILRADFETEIRLRLGPPRGLRLDLASALRVEDWMQAGHPWTSRYITLRGGLGWRRDFD